MRNLSFSEGGKWGEGEREPSFLNCNIIYYRLTCEISCFKFHLNHTTNEEFDFFERQIYIFRYIISHSSLLAAIFGFFPPNNLQTLLPKVAKFVGPCRIVILPDNRIAKTGYPVSGRISGIRPNFRPDSRFTIFLHFFPW